eukprot:3140486-Pyramimonas_sp.AAC.1
MVLRYRERWAQRSERREGEARARAEERISEAERDAKAMAVELERANQEVRIMRREFTTAVDKARRAEGLVAELTE